MRKVAAALVACFATATSAFLIPPEVSDHLPAGFKDTTHHGGPPEHFKDFIHALLEQKTTIVDLDCPGCSFAAGRTERDGQETILWEPQIDNVVHLEFKTNGHMLKLNEHPLLPLDKARKMHEPVKAYQIRKDSNEQSVELPLNFAMEVMPPMSSPHKDGVSLVPVEFTVLGLNGLPIKVNTIALKLIQAPNGDLIIVKSEEIPFEDTPGADTCEGARPWSLCRLRAIVTTRMKSVIEAAKGKTHNVHGWVKEKTHACGKHPRPEDDAEHPHPGRTGHHKQHGHHGHQRHHRLGYMIHQTFRFFVIPALLGVIGGLAASAIGMLVGQAIVFFWFRSYRDGRRGPLRVAEHDVTLYTDETEKMLAERGDPLPEYKDAPRYEDEIQRDTEAEAAPLVDEKH